MPWRVEIKKILDGDTAQIQQAIAAGFVLTGALQTRRGRTYLKKTFILPTAPKKKAVVVPAGGVGFDMSALSEALDQVAEANAAAAAGAGAAAAAAGAGPAAAGAGAGAAAAPEWGGEEPIALEVADADVDGLIAAMGGVAFQGGRRRRNRKTKSRRSKRRHTRKN